MLNQTVYWERVKGYGLMLRGCQPVNQRWVFGLVMSKADTLDVARESVTVKIIELPRFPSESASLSDKILSNEEMVGRSMVVPEYKSARVWFHRMANGWCLGNKMSVY